MPYFTSYLKIYIYYYKTRVTCKALPPTLLVLKKKYIILIAKETVLAFCQQYIYILFRVLSSETLLEQLT